LIETIIAAVILTTALVALAQLLAVSVKMHKLGRDSAQATRLAQDKFEELMKLNFATAPAL
jgi:Tfp pilus assembly protein PilV